MRIWTICDVAETCLSLEVSINLNMLGVLMKNRVSAI